MGKVKIQKSKVKKKTTDILFPGELEIEFDVGVEGTFNWAGAGHAFEDFFLLVVEWETSREIDMCYQFTDPAGVAYHDLGNFCTGAVEVGVHGAAGLDGHGGNHACCQCRGYEVGG